MDRTAADGKWGCASIGRLYVGIEERHRVEEEP